MGSIGKRVLACAIAVLTTFAVSLGVSAVVAGAAGTVAWSIRGVAEPTHFSHNDATRCETHSEECDRYQLLVMDVGSVPSSGSITVTDKLPPGITTAQTPESRGEWSCTSGSGQTEVVCTTEEPVGAGHDARPITILVNAPSAASGSLKNEVSITGGGTEAVASSSEETLISSQPPPFGMEFGVEAGAPDGSASVQAGAHPWQLTTSLEFPTVVLPVVESQPFEPLESLKNVAVELPIGLVGDPQAAAKCTQTQFGHERCPAASSVGSVAIGTEGFSDEFSISHDHVTSALYNMVPEGGYPAEFAFSTVGASVYLYASVVHTGSGYRLRVASPNPGLPDALGAFGTVLTFYGEPAKAEGESSETAFLTNPTSCTTTPQTARAEAESWENPGHAISEEATVYPELTGCDLLQSQFHPELAMGPSEAGVGPRRKGLRGRTLRLRTVSV